MGARLDVDDEAGDNIGRRLAPGEQKSAHCGDTDEPGTDATEPVESSGRGIFRRRDNICGEA